MLSSFWVVTSFDKPFLYFQALEQKPSGKGILFKKVNGLREPIIVKATEKRPLNSSVVNVRIHFSMVMFIVYNQQIISSHCISSYKSENFSPKLMFTKAISSLNFMEDLMSNNVE